MDFLRQLNLAPPETLAAVPVTIIGCGAIGSFAALAMAKSGFSKFTLYDADDVAAHNLPVQFFRRADLGKPKADVTAEMIRDFGGATVTAHARHFEESDSAERGIAILATDTIASRAMAYHALLASGIDALIDARMGAEVLRALYVPMNVESWRKRYEAELHPSEESEQAPCTARSIIYTVLGAASVIANMAKRHAMRQALPPEVVMDFKTFESFVFVNPDAQAADSH